MIAKLMYTKFDNETGASIAIDMAYLLAIVLRITAYATCNWVAFGTSCILAATIIFVCWPAREYPLATAIVCGFGVILAAFMLPYVRWIAVAVYIVELCVFLHEAFDEYIE